MYPIFCFVRLWLAKLQVEQHATDHYCMTDGFALRKSEGETRFRDSPTLIETNYGGHEICCPHPMEYLEQKLTIEILFHHPSLVMD